MKKKPLLGSVLLLLPALAFSQSQTSVSTGLDYSEGKYGQSEKSTTWALPVIVKHERGPLTLKLNLPYVQTSGMAAPGGDRTSSTKQTQSGWGDATASAFYNVYSDSAARLGVDLGGKIKFATADRANTLLTTGKNDYSLQADVFKGIADTTLFGSLGWTRKGDPDGTDFRNPWYASVGFSNKLSDANSWGATYDYRQKVTQSGDPISEASLFFVHKYSKQVKVQGYVVAGLSDASPDLGVGATIGYGF